MTETNKLTLAEQAELRGLAERIREHQQKRGRSDAALCKEYPKLGHTRTFKRCLEGDLAELKGRRWLQQYRDVLGALDASVRGDEVYTDLGPAESLALAVLDAMESGGIDRVVLMLGDSGAGKSGSLRALQQRYGVSRVVSVEARESWKENPNPMLRAILAALRVQDLPVGMDAMIDAIVEESKSRQVCLCIDEAHHCGPRALNVIKTLVNQTRWEFVIAAYSTLWGRLSQAAYHEARQLTQNRLAAKILIASVSVADAEKMLGRGLSWLEKDTLPKAAKLVAKHAAANGYLAFVRNVIRAIEREHEGELLVYEDIEQAVRNVLGGEA